MSADNENHPRGHRFSVEDARARAQQAYRKSEFIFSRAYGLLREPNKEWQQIRAEETTVPNILLGYVAPLAAIPPVAGLIGALVFEPIRVGPIDSALVSVVVTWIVTVALVFLLGLLINALADQFDADRDDLSAHKIAAYSLTPAFLSGLFSLWPPLWWLSLFALAAMVYVMYRGLPILMKTPPERALSYAASVTIAAMVAGIVLFSLASCVG
ncbi:MAG TPA: Yip1 family protein [Vitreimonas sp.]|uniref:Yip1 family protein n=1 Tax=Vitreimonas sp. TaxID=3069702 RepID=UPI002D691F70|nr:Yip1 family protein [Vitreimonas sp.]HYD86960.1 Yip1 family protein [Vitreimonas sp.]